MASHITIREMPEISRALWIPELVEIFHAITGRSTHMRFRPILLAISSLLYSITLVCSKIRPLCLIWAYSQVHRISKRRPADTSSIRDSPAQRSGSRISGRRLIQCPAKKQEQHCVQVIPQALAWQVKRAQRSSSCKPQSKQAVYTVIPSVPDIWSRTVTDITWVTERADSPQAPATRCTTS